MLSNEESYHNTWKKKSDSKKSDSDNIGQVTDREKHWTNRLANPDNHIDLLFR